MGRLLALLLALLFPLAASAQDLPPGSTIADPAPLPRLVLNLTARGGSERGAFLVAYGHALFRSPEILGPRARALGMSCATCHTNGDVNRALFVAGLSDRKGGIDVTTSAFDGTAENGLHDPLDIPSLRGVRFTAPYGHDGRIASLREFVAAVIVTEFGGAEPTTLMLDALTAFLDQLDFLPAPFVDRGGKLKANAPTAAKRGAALFDAHCASCHRPDSYFADGRRHDVGSGGGFDTPTLLGIVHTAPYMHDGSLATLADTVAFFDKSLRLKLSRGQKSDLTAYLQAVGTGTEPNAREDAKTLRARDDAVAATALDTLIARRDRFHTMLLIRSLAPRLGAPIDAIGAAVLAEDWGLARRRWDAYRRMR